MSYTSYCPEADLSAGGTEQTAHRAGGAERTGAGGSAGRTGVGATGTAEVALRGVLAGVSGGAGPGEFQSGIDACQRMLGNRAFLQWVGELRSAGRGAVEQGGAAPLQMMPKKRKKPGIAEAEAEPPASAQPAPAHALEAGFSGGTQEDAGAGSAGDAGMAPVSKKGKRPRTETETETETETKTLRSEQGHEPEMAAIATIRRDLNQKEKELLDACLKGNTRQFTKLMKYKYMDINMANGFGTVLCHAACGGHVGIVDELLKSPDIHVNLAGQEGATPLILAAREGHVKVVQLLLRKPGINVNLTTVMGVTPLYAAAESGRLEVVKLLLAAPELDIDRQQSNGATALFVAAQQNFPGIVEQLVRRGADVGLALSDGTSPLYSAAYGGYLEVVRVLLQAPGIRVDQAAGGRLIPLGAAAQQGYKNIVRLLLLNGADPNIKGDTGLTPLHVACLYGHTAIAEMLLHSGADPDTGVTVHGGQAQTPYSLAESCGHPEVMSVLEVYRRRREAAQRLERLPETEAPAGSTGAPAPASGTELEGEALAAAARVSPLPPTPALPGETVRGTAPPVSLAQAKQALREEMQDKFLPHCIDRKEGMQLLEAVNAAADLDSLRVLYNGLAHIERGWWRWRVEAAAPVFALGERTGLDAEDVEREIKVHLGRAYHRYVSQAVNDMVFGRGKPTPGYPALCHATAGVPGLGSCSVFYYLEGSEEQFWVRVAGIGHHLDAGTCRLDYASAELGGVGRILHIT